MENDQAVLFRKIRSADYEFPDSDWGHISDDAIDLIKGLLVINPKERWSIEECMRCKWLRQDSSELSGIGLTDSVNRVKGSRGPLRSIARAIMFLGTGSKTTAEVATKAPLDADAESERGGDDPEQVGIV